MFGLSGSPTQVGIPLLPLVHVEHKESNESVVEYERAYDRRQTQCII